MATTPAHRVVVHQSGKGWSWKQVSRNGSNGATAPSPFDNKANAKRAAERQVAALKDAVLVLEG